MRARVGSLSLFFSFVVGLGLASCATAPEPTPSSTPAPVAAPAVAATPASAEPDDGLGKVLPTDARIKTGKLANGLAYYVLPHSKPEKRGYFWLAVNTGSVLEDDDQRGLAHFVEHMAFNGTKRFPKAAIVNFIESIGVRFGADLNAYTSFDETVYQLQVPTDKPELVGKAMQILRDWAGDVTFDPAEVDKERGVVLEEWRLGRGAGMRLFDKQAPVLFHGSKYAERNTIGKPEIIKGAPRDAVVRFYKDWYRPNLMAVIAVGDFDAADIEKRIVSEFGDLANPPKDKERPRENVAVPAHEKTLVSIETDPELPVAQIGIISKLPHRPERTERDYRRFVGDQLFGAMLNARFDELRRKPDAPFLFAFAGPGDFVRATDAFTSNAVVKEGMLDRAFELLVDEVERVGRHGFTEGELDRARKSVLRSYHQGVLQRDKRDGATFASEIVRNFLEGEMMPGAEGELALAERFVPSFSLAELNRMAAAWDRGSHVISINGPDKMPKPSPDALLATVARAKTKPLEPWRDAASSVPLMAALPKPGVVKKTRTIAEIGVTEWTLANGVKVVVKPTDFRNDEVSISGFSPGGHSLVKDADFESAQFADDVVGEGGVGALSAVDLRKALSGKVARAFAWVGELQEGVNGGGSPQDLETILQLVNLRLTGARRDEEAFRAWRSGQIESVKNRLLDPQQVFFEDMQRVMSQDHRRRRPVTPETIEKVDLDKALAVYRDRFADAGDFTFVIVGNVDLEKLKPLVETYLGSLPAKGRKEKWKDVGAKMPKGVATKEVLKGTEPKSSVVIAFHGNEKWSRDTENDMRMLGEVLRIRLREILREDLGGVYGVSAGGGISRRPRPEYQFTVSFGCAPENVEKLKKAVFDEVKEVQDKGASAEVLQKVKETRVRTHEVSLKENGFWMRELSRAWDFGDDPKKIPDIKPMVEKVTSDRVKAAAKKYLREKEYVLGVLRPEKVDPAQAAAGAAPR